MSGFTVDYRQLMSAASRIFSEADRYDQTADTLKAAADQLANCWEGPASCNFATSRSAPTPGSRKWPPYAVIMPKRPTSPPAATTTPRKQPRRHQQAVTRGTPFQTDLIGGRQYVNDLIE